jgi:hypothetical protein
VVNCNLAGDDPLYPASGYFYGTTKGVAMNVVFGALIIAITSLAIMALVTLAKIIISLFRRDGQTPGYFHALLFISTVGALVAFSLSMFDTEALLLQFLGFVLRTGVGLFNQGLPFPQVAGR